MTDHRWPQLTDVRIHLDLISKWGRAAHLQPEPFIALTALVSRCASAMCHTYTGPGDGSLPDDDVMLAKLTFFSLRKWKKLRPEVQQFFRIEDGRWHLTEDWIGLDDRRLRQAIPADVLRRVQFREGKVCTYCGDEDGPFDYDHIFPLSRGGSNDPSNLAVACASCNRSKGAKTLKEWMGR